MIRRAFLNFSRGIVLLLKADKSLVPFQAFCEYNMAIFPPFVPYDVLLAFLSQIENPSGKEILLQYRNVSHRPHYKPPKSARYFPTIKFRHFFFTGKGNSLI